MNPPCDYVSEALREDGETALRQLADRSIKERRNKTRGQAGNDSTSRPTEGADNRRPVIRIVAGALYDLATKAEDALIAAGVPFYSRGGEIVRPIVEEVAAFRGRRTKIARLRPVTEDMMRDELSRAARWERFDGRTKKLVAADPPKDVAKTLLSRDGAWRLPRLVRVITTPTLRPDGSILAVPGYDPITKLLLIAPPPMPVIPQRPSRDDALAALALLDGLLDEFPFITDADRSVGLSALMTPVARGAMQVAPLHALTAPEAGSGKSYLIDIAAAIANGEIAPVIAAGRTEEETEKRLGAELMTAQPIVSIDNLNGELSGDFLCQAIERPTVKPRVLGLSKTVRIQNTVCLFGNGNNLRLVGDVVRRVLLCSLDANMERPELRTFRCDPVATVLVDRGRYITAVLTIVRAYLDAGCPGLCAPVASFDDWSRLIRSPLVWLGRADPVATMEAARTDDPSRANLRAVVAAWHTAIGPNKPLTAGELRDKAGNSTDPEMTLHKALLVVAFVPRRNEIDATKLGLYLRRNRGRVVDGLKIFGEEDKHLKQVRWWLG
jgi:putative DNA primase/helicase